MQTNATDTQPECRQYSMKKQPASECRNISWKMEKPPQGVTQIEEPNSIYKEQSKTCLSIKRSTATVKQSADNGGNNGSSSEMTTHNK
jgi:hypothetical protein